MVWYCKRVRRFQERNIEPYVSSLEDESLKEGTAVLTLRLWLCYCETLWLSTKAFFLLFYKIIRL
jgi:hypothetical protein